MKYAQKSLCILMFFGTIKTLTMDENNAQSKQSQSTSQTHTDPNFFKTGTQLVACQAVAVTWWMIQEFNWIRYQSYAKAVCKGELPKDLKVPLSLTASRLTTRIGSILLVGFAFAFAC